MIPIGETIKDAWTLTWRYKVLWLFAFLYGGGSNLRISEQRGAGEPATALERSFQSFFSSHPAAAAALVLLAVVALFAWIAIVVAANGGLVWLTREAALGHSPTARDGFRFGFRKWGRTFLFGLLVSVIALLILAIVIALAFIPILGWAVDFVIVVALLVLGGPLLAFGLRFALLADMVPSAGLGAASRLLKAKFRAIVPFALAMIGIAIGFAAVTGALALPVLFVARKLVDEGQYVFGTGILLVAWLVLLMPAVWYTTFSETAWTLAFERVAHEPAAVQPAAAYPVSPPAPPASPVEPPAAWPAPPAAPTAPAPPAPPTEPPAPDA